MQTETELQYRHARPVYEIVYFSQLKTAFPLCPHCKQALDREYINFCSYCGQKLSWKGFRQAHIIIR